MSGVANLSLAQLLDTLTPRKGEHLIVILGYFRVSPRHGEVPRLFYLGRTSIAFGEHLTLIDPSATVNVVVGPRG